jgi:hypothetical protein
MARGDRREEIFGDDRDRSQFLGYLAEGAERYRVKVHCYVLMQNHFDLVPRTPKGNLQRLDQITKNSQLQRGQPLTYDLSVILEKGVTIIFIWSRRRRRATSRSGFIS